MAVLSCLIWTLVIVVIVHGTFKWYVPYLILHKQIGDTDNIEFQITIQFKVILFFLSLAEAALCGFFSGERHDSWINVCKMILALCILNVIAITDLLFYIIPNVCVLFLIGGRIMSMGLELINREEFFLMGFTNSLIAGMASLLFLLVISKITHGGIGYGDVKLFGALGFLCGVRANLYTLVLSFFLCSIISIILLLSKKKGMKDGLPLGPFVWIGFGITIILGLC